MSRDAVIADIEKADSAAGSRNFASHRPSRGGITRPSRTEIDDRHFVEREFERGRQHGGSSRDQNWRVQFRAELTRAERGRRAWPIFNGGESRIADCRAMFMDCSCNLWAIIYLANHFEM